MTSTSFFSFLICVAAVSTVPSFNQDSILDYECKYCKILIGKTCVFSMTAVSVCSDLCMSAYMQKGSTSMCVFRGEVTEAYFCKPQWEVQAFWSYTGDCFQPHKL